MIRLIYVSSATKYPTEQDLQSLITQLRGKNLKYHITGMLLYGNGTYLQLLEGEAEEVHDIYRSICSDSRNIGNVKLLEEEIDHRDFPDNPMGFRNLQQCSNENLPDGIDLSGDNFNKESLYKNVSKTIELLLSFSKHAA